MSKLSMPNTNEPFKLKRTGNNLGESIHKAMGGKDINNPLKGTSKILNKSNRGGK